MDSIETKDTEISNLKHLIDEAKNDVKETKQELKQVEEKFMFVSLNIFTFLKVMVASHLLKHKFI